MFRNPYCQEGIALRVLRCSLEANRRDDNGFFSFPYTEERIGNFPGREEMQSIPPTALARLNKLHASIVRVIRGKNEIIELLTASLLAHGHVLLEDVPGVGKTTLARAVAHSLDLLFHRIQFTSDTLPSDLTGLTVYRKNTESFEFIEGPLFANIVLADEINRATPRTQSALLEAMSEGSISIDGEQRKLPSPFMVIATQNPVEATGTYPLPESQMDRFLMRLRMGYPSPEEELQLLRDGGTETDLGGLQPVMTIAELHGLQKLIPSVHLETSLRRYLLDAVLETRKSPDLLLGVSTRGALSWQRSARALALLRGRAFVTPDDLIDTAVPVLAHRIIPAGLPVVSDVGRSTRERRIIRDILAEIPIPR